MYNNVYYIIKEKSDHKTNKKMFRCDRGKGNRKQLTKKKPQFTD